MVAQCGGLPLALCALGRAMSNKRDPREWRSARSQLRAISLEPCEIDLAKSCGTCHRRFRSICCTPTRVVCRQLLDEMFAYAPVAACTPSAARTAAFRLLLNRTPAVHRSFPVAGLDQTNSTNSAPISRSTTMVSNRTLLVISLVRLNPRHTVIIRGPSNHTSTTPRFVNEVH